MTSNKYRSLIDECYGNTHEESIRKVAEKIWEAGGMNKGLDYENWKAAEWMHGHIDTLTEEVTRTTGRYIDAENALVSISTSWQFRVMAFLFPSLSRTVDETLLRAQADDIKSCD